jgi:tRNA (guanine26-N2/guanine27-N2)-dimethyltransferase
MYGGPLHNPGFIQRVLAQLNDIDQETYPTSSRIEGMLHTALDEITFGTDNKESTKSEGPKQLDPIIPKTDPATLDDAPFFFIPSSVSKVLHCQAPSTAAVRGALRHAGFKVTMSHCKPGTIRTDASWTAIWHIMLEWVRQRAPLKNSLRESTAGYHIMSKQIIPEAEEDEGKEPETSTEVEGSDTGPKAVGENQQNAKLAKNTKPETQRPSYQGVNFEVKFDEQLGRDPDRGRYVRYQLAPRENWGPMARAK